MFKKKPFKRKYRQSDNFLGFRRIPLSVYGHAPSEKGCAALLGKDLSRARIVVFEIDMSKSVSDALAFGVEVNGHHIGAAFDSDAFPLFAADLVDAVYIRIRTYPLYPKTPALRDFGILCALFVCPLPFLSGK